MIHIQYRLDKSHKHGIGLFANQDIQAGELVYSASPKLDLNISQETFESLKSGEQEEIRYWGFWIEENKVWHVDFDMSKFINHSFQANISQDATKTDTYLIAVRDIKKGEELTQNYLEFETESDLLERGITLDGDKK